MRHLTLIAYGFLMSLAMLCPAVRADEGTTKPSASAADRPLLTVNVRLHLLKSEKIKQLDCQMTEAEANKLFDGVNEIWKPANIAFKIESIVTDVAQNEADYQKIIDDKLAGPKNATPWRGKVTASIYPMNTMFKPGWNVFFIQDFGDVAGGVYQPQNLSIVIGFKNHGHLTSPSVMAHELGHSLSLMHVEEADKYNLMIGHPTGVPIDEKIKLNPEQIEAARAQAAKGQPSPPRNRGNVAGLAAQSGGPADPPKGQNPDGQVPGGQGQAGQGPGRGNRGGQGTQGGGGAVAFLDRMHQVVNDLDLTADEKPKVQAIFTKAGEGAKALDPEIQKATPAERSQKMHDFFTKVRADLGEVLDDKQKQGLEQKLPRAQANVQGRQGGQAEQRGPGGAGQPGGVRGQSGPGAQGAQGGAGRPAGAGQGGPSGPRDYSPMIKRIQDNIDKATPTDEQKEKIKPVMDNLHKMLDELPGQGKTPAGDPTAMRDQFRKVITDFRADLEKVLGAEKFKVYSDGMQAGEAAMRQGGQTGAKPQ